MTASHQWSTRPYDERFAGTKQYGPVTEAKLAARMHRRNSKAIVVANRELSAHPVEGDDHGIVLMRGDNVAVPTNWAWGQLCQRAGAPASYLRDLPSPLAADNLNWGLHYKRDVESMGILLRSNGQGPLVTAATGKDYGRIWDDDVLEAIEQRFGDGRSGDFRVPGEFGKRVEITKENTTVYASDRDMFVFLADEERRIDVPNRRDGKSGSMARGFFVGNSEVGAATLSIDTFLFDYVCCNRIVWGASDVARIRIRHTSGAPYRFVEEVAPALEEYAASSTKTMLDTIKNAKQKSLGEKDKVMEFLSKRFTRSQAVAFNTAHEQEEGRPIETLWDAVTGATAYAKTIQFQDARVDLERKAGALLDLVAA
jgi:RNAse (barnase) inhibitor barstar